MPKLERLDWVVPLSDGQGVTLSDEPAADALLAEDPNALLLGVLYDSQYPTRKAFALPLRLKERLGHLEMQAIADEDPERLVAVFLEKPCIHRFPRKFALQTQQLARVVSDRYGGDSSRIWTEAAGVDDLGRRIMELPAFGVEKTNWTVGMLGRLGLLNFGAWEGYRVKQPRKPKAGQKTRPPNP